MINWARFVSYKDDPVALAMANNQACGDEKTKYWKIDIGLAGFNGLNMFPVDWKQEVAAWQLIKDCVQTRLNDYPESIEFDTRLLEQDDLLPAQRACIEFRQREKITLRVVIIAANWIQKVLQMNRTAAQEEV